MNFFTRQAITFELSQDATFITHNTHKVMGVLQEVGGLSKVLLTSAAVFVAIFMAGSDDTYLATQLYRPPKDGKSSPGISDEKANKEGEDPT